LQRLTTYNHTSIIGHEGPRLVTVLVRLPLFYNPDAQAGRELVEDEKFLRTAEEIAQQFGGGTLFVFRREDP
jgi:hypothetical protein